MKKIIALVIGAVFLLGVFSGCITCVNGGPATGA